MLESLFVFLNLEQADIPVKRIDVVALECIYSASSTYDLFPPYLLAVAEQEGGNHDSRVKNSNGTYDLGYMQFNTAYIKTLNKYGITEADVSQKSCYPYYLAAWRIANHIKNDSGSIIQRISNYHSRTPKYNEIYRNSLKTKIGKWNQWHMANISKLRVKGSSTDASAYFANNLYSSEDESSEVIHVSFNEPTVPTNDNRHFGFQYDNEPNNIKLILKSRNR